MTNELNVLALIKGNEHYIFVYDDEARPDLIDTLRYQAAEPGLSFNWFDAMVLTTKAREQAAADAGAIRDAPMTGHAKHQKPRHAPPTFRDHRTTHG